MLHDYLHSNPTSPYFCAQKLPLAPTSKLRMDFDEAFRADIKPSTGDCRVSCVHTCVCQCISCLTRDTTAFWIGITFNKEEGCRKRWNDKYKSCGMNQMAMQVYETSSKDFCEKVEEDLIEYYKECRPELQNNTGLTGGGGKRRGRSTLCKLCEQMTRSTSADDRDESLQSCGY